MFSKIGFGKYDVWIRDMKYFDALNRSGKILEAYFEQSKDVLHSASKGTIREEIIEKVIRPFLPQCYGISTGEAFDKDGNTSRQLDLIVYDSIFSYAIPYTDNFIQFPCESVYGVIEIKSMLNREEFFTAIENIKSMKCLRREGTHDWTFTPLVQISINGRPNNTDRNKYFGIIFAYDSVETDTILEYIKELACPPQFLPNAIVLMSKKTIILPYNSQKKIIHTIAESDFDAYITFGCGEKVFSLFIGLLINYTRTTLLKVANIHDQTNATFNEILRERWGMEKWSKINDKRNSANV